MHFDCYSFGRPMQEIGPMAREAEDMGFSALWFTESRHNPFVAATASGLVTERMLIGTNIAVAFPRSPMVTAQVAWDLAQGTGGRFVLGLGSQVKAHIVRRFSVPFSQPAARLAEYVRAVRSIFRAFQGEERLRFEGQFYQFSLLTDFFNPGPIEHPDIPIYLAGVNVATAAAAGEVADGVNVHPLHTIDYLNEVLRPALRRGTDRADRPAGAVALAIPVFMIVGDTDAEVDAQREGVRRQIAFYGSTPTYRSVFEHHGWHGVSEELGDLMRRGDVEAMSARITDEMLELMSVTAGWDDLGAVLLERYRGVADRLMPYGTAGDWQRDPALAERWREVAAAVGRG
jgi:probable F420-dependent oxidoreductase